MRGAFTVPTGIGRAPRRKVTREWRPDAGELVVRHGDDLEYLVLFSPEDYELIAPIPWSVEIYGYAVHNDLRMHRMVMGLDFKDGRVLDHLDGNRRNNRRENLRLATVQLNAQNQKLVNERGASKYRGVTWSSQKRKWRAVVTINYKGYDLGFFTNEMDAAAAAARFRELHDIWPGYGSLHADVPAEHDPDLTTTTEESA